MFPNKQTSKSQTKTKRSLSGSVTYYTPQPTITNWKNNNFLLIGINLGIFLLGF